MLLKKELCQHIELKSTPLIKLAMMLLKKGDQHLQQSCGLTHAQLQVLIYVDCLGPISQHELAQNLDLTQAAISRLTETMVKKGLLHRVTDPTNRRANKVSVTAKGKHLIVRAVALMQKLESTLYAHISESSFRRWQTTTLKLLSLVAS